MCHKSTVRKGGRILSPIAGRKAEERPSAVSWKWIVGNGHGRGSIQLLDKRRGISKETPFVRGGLIDTALGLVRMLQGVEQYGSIFTTTELLLYGGGGYVLRGQETAGDEASRGDTGGVHRKGS